MIITNNCGLPVPLYKAICADTYSRGESAFTTTELALPSRIYALKKQYSDKITVDASDRIYSLLGQAVHLILERIAQDQAYIVEKRFYVDVAGKKLGGQIDLYVKEEKHLHDWKLCPKSTDGKGVKDEWEAQANVNRFILESQPEPIPVVRATYVGIYRDWVKIMAAKSPSYPPPVGQFQIAMWPFESIKPWIVSRIGSHLSALETLPECSSDDRWSKGEKWALMRKGRKTAVRLYDTKEEAEGAVESPKDYVEHRPAEDTRCQFYCEVKQFCSYAIAKGYANPAPCTTSK